VLECIAATADTPAPPGEALVAQHLLVRSFRPGN